MTASVVCTPNPTQPLWVDVNGAGFTPRSYVSVAIDGVGTTTKIGVKNDGTFSVGGAVASTKADGTYPVIVYAAGTKTILAKTTLTVKKIIVPPVVPPVVPPTSTAAVGFASAVTGGDLSGAIVRVTNLNDAGPGSLREALQGANRKVVFDVGGTIALQSVLEVRDSDKYNITIAGETAPGPGITLLNYPLWWKYGAHDIWVRSIRHRGQNGIFLDQGGGCFNHTQVHNILYQNVSSSGWCEGSEGWTAWDDDHDITVMDSFSGGGQPLFENGLVAGTHDYPMATGKHVYNITFYRNLMYQPTYRAPSLGWYDSDTSSYPPAGVISGEVINNLIWDYGGHVPGGHDSAYGTTIYYHARANVVNNYYYSSYWAGTNRGFTGAIYDAEAYGSGNYSKDGGSVIGNVSSPLPGVPASARITPATPASAAAYILDHGGCRVGGLDALDQSWVDSIRAVGL